MCSATVGSAEAWPRPPQPRGRRAHARAGLPPASLLTGPLQALATQPFPLRGPGLGGVPTAQPPTPLTYTSSWFSQASLGHNGPRGSAATSTSRAALSPRVTPADTAPQACGRMSLHLLRPQQPRTFSAEALTRRHRLSPPRAASPGSSPAGRSGRNVSIDMYIPQCCTFVCSNHVNTCMDFIIYILYINL